MLTKMHSYGTSLPQAKKSASVWCVTRVNTSLFSGGETMPVRPIGLTNRSIGILVSNR